MTEEFKNAIKEELMITLGTDIEKKFAWCLRYINNEPFIFLHERHDGMSCFSEQDYITSFAVKNILNIVKYEKD